MHSLAFTRIALSVSLATAIVGGAGPARGQLGAPPPEVAAAQAALQAGLADSAIRTLEAFFAKNPNAVAGRMVLATAYEKKGDLDRALATYEAITVPRPMRLQAMYAVAGIHSRRGNIDAAIETLRKLKGTGAFDMDLARTNPDLEAARRDARFASIFFTPGEFTHPFVEPVRIIHEWVGEAKGDQFSWIARGIGDVDGDGASDIVTSAPTFGANGTPSGPGKVYVYSGRTGTLLWSHTGDAGESLGIGLEGAGDVNGDGAGDVIAGAPGAGRAYVFSGRDGAILLRLTGSKDEGYGSSTSGAGDVNGDGHADVVVGAPTSNANGNASGRAYVVSGRDGTTLMTLDGERAGDAFGSIVGGDKFGRGTPIVVGAPGAGPKKAGQVYEYARGSRTPTHVMSSDDTGIALGAMFTSVVGDVNGDSVPDIYATDYTNSAKGPSTGRAYIDSGKDGTRLLTLTGENPGDGFGIGSADVGDVNHDGFADLLVGAWQFSGVAPSGGKVYLYSGKDGTLLRAITGRIPGETLGFDATGVGDVDGDGTIDLLVTSTWSNIRGFRSGRMYVISGR